ncbi:MAG: RtcB family protein [Petrotogales bacterium]
MIYIPYYSPKKKLKSWIPLEKIDEKAIQQIDNLSTLPDIFKWIAIMPDVHPGFGMPIGGVLALRENIIPNAVGVDIGCGVVSVKTSLKTETVKPVLKELLNEIMKKIPLGHNWRKSPLVSSLFDEVIEDRTIQKELKNAEKQLGTLGGGNHFIEIQQDEEDIVYLTLHTGSRNLGNKVASAYHKLAKRYCKINNIDVPSGLDYFPYKSTEGSSYLKAMNFCVRFASENRQKIADIVLNIMDAHVNNLEERERIETIHNYAQLENHFNKQVMVHRKGAVEAKRKVIIPGSMGTATYICEGLENPDAFRSCSHGAGRVMGRNEAKKKLRYEDIMKDLEKRNLIVVSPSKKSIVEEARQVYKNIEEVMDYQRDLARPIVKLTPLGVVKG